jgi:hypothetical protein
MTLSKLPFALVQYSWDRGNHSPSWLVIRPVATLVALLFALATVRRRPRLRLAGLSLGVLYALAVVLLSLLSTFVNDRRGRSTLIRNKSRLLQALVLSPRVSTHAVA